MFGTYDLERMKLPSGRGDDAPEIRSAETLDRLDAWLERAYPGGIESVMPEDVLSNGTIEPYDVLPRLAGLVQLVRSGHLSVLSDRTFSIDRPIPRFPTGLGGRQSVEFVLRRGVPMPKGDPGHSLVLIEETGECIGARCSMHR